MILLDLGVSEEFRDLNLIAACFLISNVREDVIRKISCCFVHFSLSPLLAKYCFSLLARYCFCSGEGVAVVVPVKY